jgi:hypothetical protein
MGFYLKPLERDSSLKSFLSRRMLVPISVAIERGDDRHGHSGASEFRRKARDYLR